MNLKLAYFSPTGTSKRIVKMIADNISTVDADYDITLREQRLHFRNTDIVVLGIPVYSGRVPKLANEKLKIMTGDNTLLVLVATYGNRHYDDSLLELKSVMQENGFRVLAAAAFVSEHSVIQKFGRGRPDNEDIQAIHRFADDIKEKIASLNEKEFADLKISGNPDYRKYKSIPIKPHANSLCVRCGLCAKNCPAGAIPHKTPNKTNRSKCVTCVRCIRICPNKARSFFAIEEFIAEKSLEKLCKEYKHPEIFI